jgi:hypothetical protein
MEKNKVHMALALSTEAVLYRKLSRCVVDVKLFDTASSKPILCNNIATLLEHSLP